MNPELNKYFESPVIIAIAAVVICQLAYWYLLHQFRNRVTPSGEGEDRRTIIIFFTYRKLMGVFTFFLIPLIIALIISEEGISDLFVKPNASFSKVLLIAGAGLLIIPVSFFTARQKKVYGMYPEMRLNEWDVKLFLISALGWTVYNFSYEFMFRGFLLQQCLPLGITPAIVINLVLYSLLHLNKGWQEAVGAIPFGLILCLVTLYSGTFIASFVVHTILSVSTEFFAIRHNPVMSFIKVKA